MLKGDFIGALAKALDEMTLEGSPGVGAALDLARVGLPLFPRVEAMHGFLALRGETTLGPWEAKEAQGRLDQVLREEPAQVALEGRDLVVQVPFFLPAWAWKEGPWEDLKPYLDRVMGLAAYVAGRVLTRLTGGRVKPYTEVGGQELKGGELKYLRGDPGPVEITLLEVPLPEALWPLVEEWNRYALPQAYRDEGGQARLRAIVELLGERPGEYVGRLRGVLEYLVEARLKPPAGRAQA